jgi:hypothetical protein
MRNDVKASGQPHGPGTVQEHWLPTLHLQSTTKMKVWAEGHE